jgi:PAS domain S-box-containing protein
MAEPLRVLHVGADEAATVAADALDSEADGIEADGVPQAALLERLSEDVADCVVVHDDPPAVDGVAEVKRVRDVDEDVAVVFAADGGGDERVAAALEGGATDWIGRDTLGASPAMGAHRVRAAVERAGEAESGVSPERIEGAEGDGRADLASYARILQGVGDSLYATDAEGEFTYVNPAGARLTGYDVEELLESGPSLVYEADDIAAFEDAIVRLLESPDEEVARVEADVQRVDGEVVPVEATLTVRRDADGQFAGTIGVARDMRERLERERELERYARLIEASGDAVYALDAEGRFTVSNDAHQDIVDRPESELLGSHASIALPDEAVENGQRLIADLLESDRETGTYEMDVLQPDGTRIPTENHVALLTDEDGTFRGTVGVLRDISERQAREEELERQNERLERFAEIASHDLRNPLNVAQGYLDLIEADGEPVERVGEALDRMERLIDDTLTMARQGTTVEDPTTVDLGTLVPECWDAVGTDDATLDLVEDVAVRADESRLQQLLENLLRNAIEHGGADVTVRIGALEDGFYVEDDGPGIPASERESVFEAGQTTAEDGTGFGLAIVAEIVDAHGWSIDLTESEAGGARFEITGVDERT